MTINYDPDAPRGQQWTVSHNGKPVAGMSRNDAAAMLRSEGRSINEAAIELTKAKLQASRA